MKDFIKTLFPGLPKSLQVFLLKSYEYLYTIKILILHPKLTHFIFYNTKDTHKRKKILFYHISGLSFGGTEKNLQVIAKYLNKKKYDVYYMYSPKSRVISGSGTLDGRLDYLKNEKITFIPFDYQRLEQKYPYYVEKQEPNFFTAIESEKIDLVITAGSGYSEYPFNILRKTPIILLNIFGSPTTQNNIKKIYFVSKAVREKTLSTINQNKTRVIYFGGEKPKTEYEMLGKMLREKFGFTESDFIFGRIGRADDAIFDEIGIRAFQDIVKRHDNAYYLIMSAPPTLKKLVLSENIPNIIFLEPSSKEEDVFAFHNAIDALAHFRKDGESFGLNIAESMLCGKPIISHKSSIWNAHLEYLDETFSRISNTGDIKKYADHMEEFILLKKDGKLSLLGNKAREKAESLFLIENQIHDIEGDIDAILQ